MAQAKRGSGPYAGQDGYCTFKSIYWKGGDEKFVLISEYMMKTYYLIHF